MFGVSRLVGLLGERRVRAVSVGATIGCVVIAASAGYTVQRGDTLSEIARDNGTTVSVVAKANDLSNPNYIRAGQVLTIPGTDRTHTVARGESLGEIAAQYRVTVSKLVKANDLSNPNLIRIGQTLKVPTTGGGGGGTGGGGTGGGGGGSGGGDGGGATTSHVVKAGETLASIAARYGTTVGKLADLNDLANPSLIVAGSTLSVTASGSGGSETPAESPERTHKVASGETLSEIAARYRTTTSAITKLNDLRSADNIRVGQTLRIPAGGGDQGGGGAVEGMVCPVPNSTFANDYAYIKPDGRFHQGIDMYASKGSNVLAPVSGKVDAVNGTLGGLQFWLHGDDGNLYIGTHLNGFGQVGQVSAGAVIGTVGDTGNAIGATPHLHFEILVDGKTTNPYQKLVAACR